MRRFRRRIKVTQDQGVRLGKVPFKPGTLVEVIVLPTRGAERPIYRFTDSLVKRRQIPRYSLKAIERIVHESRGIPT